MPKPWDQRPQNYFEVFSLPQSKNSLTTYYSNGYQEDPETGMENNYLASPSNCVRAWGKNPKLPPRLKYLSIRDGSRKSLTNS